MCHIIANNNFSIIIISVIIKFWRLQKLHGDEANGDLILTLVTVLRLCFANIGMQGK